MLIRPANLLGALALLSLGWQAPAWAQTVCKYTAPDGSVSYAACDSTPGKGARQELSIDPNQNVIAPERSRDTEVHEQNRRQRQADEGAPQSGAQSRSEQIAEAEADLAAAEEALRNGLETQPGDFIGRKGGGVRPSPQRHERLQQLETAVDEAHARLEALRSGR